MEPEVSRVSHAAGRAVFAALLVVALCVTLVGRVWADDEPYIGKPIEEGSNSELGLTFRDTRGLPTTPQHILLWVDDVLTTQRLYGPVGATPGPSVTLTLPPEANRIVDSTRHDEAHTITVQYRYPSGCVPVPTPGANCSTKVGEATYLVKNRRVVVGQSTPATFGPSPAPTPTPTP